MKADDTRSDTIIFGVGRISVAEGHIWGPKAPQPAKRACLPQGLALGARSAPLTLVFNIRNVYSKSDAVHVIVA